MNKQDLTLPGIKRKKGYLHLLTRTQREIESFFHHLNFETFDDNAQIEDDFYNFAGLNVPEDHPSRNSTDTFYINNKKHLLRTHTTGFQLKLLEKGKIPIKAISIGPVYRRDSDRTHLPMFRQVDGFLLEENITVNNLVVLMKRFLRWFFNDSSIAIRVRPSYFPFTNPSLEIDLKRQESDWLEVLGCGVTHPKILERYKLDSKYRAIAFGMGLERLTMIKYNITNIKDLYKGSLRLSKFFA